MFLKQSSYLFNIPSTNRDWWGKWGSTGGFLHDVARRRLSTVLHGSCWSRFVANTSGRQCFSKVERHVQQRRHRSPHIGKTKQTQWFMSICPTNIQWAGAKIQQKPVKKTLKKLNHALMHHVCHMQQPNNVKNFLRSFLESPCANLPHWFATCTRHRNMQIEGYSSDSSAAHMWLFQSTSDN